MENLNIYDSPRLLVEQMLDDELTMTGIRKTFVDPNSLSPAQREGVTARLKKAAGNTGIGDAMIGVATNPWVWAAVLLAPAHGARFGKAVAAGRNPLSVSKELSAMVRENPWMLASLGALTHNQIFDGMAVSEIIGQLIKEREGFLEGVNPVRKKVTEALRMATGAKGTLHYQDIADPVVRQKVREADLLTHLAQSGAWMDRERTVLRGKRYYAVKVPGKPAEVIPQEKYTQLVKENREMEGTAGTGGVPREHDVFSFMGEMEEKVVYEKYRVRDGSERGYHVETRPRVDRALVSRDWLMAELGRRGLLEAQQELTQMKVAAGKRVLGVEGVADTATGFEADPGKVLKNHVGHFPEASMRVGDMAGADEVEGERIIESLLDSGMVRAKEEGLVGKDLYDEFLKMTAPTGDANTYMPENVMEGWFGTSPRQRPMEGRDPHWLKASRFTPQTSEISAYHLDDIRDLENLVGQNEGTSQLREDFVMRLDEYEHAKGKKIAGNESPKDFMVKRMRALESLDRLMGDYASAHALNQAAPSEQVLAARERMLKDKPPLRQYQDPNRDLRGDPRAGVETDAAEYGNDLYRTGLEKGLSEEEARAYGEKGRMEWMSRKGTHPVKERPENLAEMLGESKFLLRDKTGHTQRMFDLMVNVAKGHGVTEHLVARASFYEAQKTMAGIADSWIGKGLEKMGGPAASFVRELRLMSSPGYLPGGGGVGAFTHGAANFFYVTHLGINLASVAMNLMQPLVLASTLLGPLAVLKAYLPAMGEMIGYAADRMKLGWNITPEQRLGLMRKNFRHFEVMGIGERDLAAVEGSSFGSGEQGTTGFFGKAFALSMKLFEKSEWLNRNVAAHAGEIKMLAAGAQPGNPLIREVQHRAMQESQFANDPLNTPTMFQNNALMANPLIRQFLTFPLRTATGLLFTAPLAGGQENYLKGLAMSSLRTMGVSAVAYEVGKGLFGADLSRGLGASSAVQIGGGNFLSEDKSYIPVPPAIDIPVNLIRAAVGGDMQLYRENLPRLIPGGIALSRTLGILPKTSLALGLQKTYADYNAPGPGGMIPIYKADDGSLIDYRSPTEMVMKGLGADLGKWGQPGELDHYLTTIREDAIGYRNQYLQAMRRGDIPRARGIKARYEKTFKLPFTVTKEQVRAAIKMTSVPRTERALDRLPEQLRVQMGPLLSGQEERLGLPKDALTQYLTSTQRTAAGVRPAPVAWPEESQEELGEAGS